MFEPYVLSRCHVGSIGSADTVKKVCGDCFTVDSEYICSNCHRTIFVPKTKKIKKGSFKRSLINVPYEHSTTKPLCIVEPVEEWALGSPGGPLQGNTDSHARTKKRGKGGVFHV